MTTLLPMPGAPKILMTWSFADGKDGGTHVELRVAKPKPKDMPFVEKVMPVAEKNYSEAFAALRTMLAERTGAPAVVDEPPLPASGERFRTQPVHGH